MTTERAGTTTILFSDLVNSTELMQRAGDEDAQRIFKAHYQLLRDAVSANAGAEVKSLGDGLMVAFSSTADAVRCAIAMQQGSRRQVASGRQLSIRVGLNVGEAMRDEGDYFGTPVVVARRLCDRADAGQILCSATVSHVLAGRSAFSFGDIGSLDLKGITDAIPACEVIYERDEPSAILARTPFVGRSAEVARLHQRLLDARAGRGGLVMLVGEPGIGKTRTSEEFAEWSREAGAVVLPGTCYEGDWAPPYGPFADALAGYAQEADAAELREDLGLGAAAIARLVPAIRERLPDIGEPEALQPEEERFRLFDAVSQFLIATSHRAPVLLLLDDVHWADRGTIGMMRHVARFAPTERMLVLGAYRDVELDRQHPLADALAALRRETEYERVVLKGLEQTEVGALLAAIAEQDVNAALVQAISNETDGNPFFIREILAHLVDEGKLYREDGTWKSTASSIADLGIPEGVRQVITRRLARLSADTNKLLTAASAFSGGFSFAIVSDVAALDEAVALDGLDEALDAQVLRPVRDAEHYDFTHALIRHTLYAEMNPSRQVRLHRRIAEAIEARVQEIGRNPIEHAAELAYQYQRSAAMPGAERGVPYAIAAADTAEAAAAWDEAAGHLRTALELMPEDDAQRPDVTGRLALALAWALREEEAVEAGTQAIRMLERSRGAHDAGVFASQMASETFGAGFTASAWSLAARALELLGDARDVAWVRARSLDLVRREAEDPDNPGMPMLSPERLELLDAVDRLGDAVAADLTGNPNGILSRLKSRDEMITGVRRFERGEAPRDAWMVFLLLFGIGDYDAGETYETRLAESQEERGQLAPAVASWSQVARAQICKGQLADARRTLQHVEELLPRLTRDSVFMLQYSGAMDEEWCAIGGPYAPLLARFSSLATNQAAENRWAMAAVFGALGRGMATDGEVEGPIALLQQMMPSVERADAAAANYARVLCHAAEILWQTQRTDFVDVIERNLREKLIATDFRYPMVDGRRSLAHVCALTGRLDEAVEWFARSRATLEAEGARPMRAIVDFDEAIMYARRSADGDAECAVRLVDAATRQFREIGMTGWVVRAETLRASLTT